MGDHYCRVYNKEALKMLVADNQLEERAQKEKQNRIRAKKSNASRSVSIQRSSLVASDSEKQLRENYMKEINKSTQKAIPSNKIRKKSLKNIKPQKQNSTIQQSSVKSPVQVQTRTGRVVKPTAKMKGQGIDNDDSTYSNQMKKLIEIILNQELGEPFRRDAMKKPVKVAGINKEDMKTQLV